MIISEFIISVENYFKRVSVMKSMYRSVRHISQIQAVHLYSLPGTVGSLCGLGCLVWLGRSVQAVDIAARALVAYHVSSCSL